MEENSLETGNSQNDDNISSKILDEILSSNVNTESNLSTTTTSTPTSKPILAEEDITTDIDKLTTTVQRVRSIFIEEVRLVRRRVYIFMWIAIIISAILTFFYVRVIGWNNFLPDFDKANTLKTWYQISLRIMFVSFFISIVVFSLKMMRNYLALYEQLRHKLAIISSMPVLVYASKNDELFKTSYTKIIDLLIQLGNTENIGKSDEILKQPLLDLITLVKKIKG